MANLAKLADLPALHGEAAIAGAAWLYHRENRAKDALKLLDPDLRALNKSNLPIDPHHQRLAVECADRVGNNELLDHWLTFAPEEGADPPALAMLQLRRAERDIQKGEIDQADRYLREALDVFEVAKDERMIAITKGQIADILVSRGELDDKLGRVDGLAVVVMTFGQFFYAGEKKAEGRQVLERSVSAFWKPGMEKQAGEAQTLLDQIGGEDA